MNIDDRKLKILAAIVEIYTATGEPVGSKAVMEVLEFNVSTATIRNEMAAMFEMGLLEQPHTSAGRVPSHTGYRVYIDRLLKCEPLTEQQKDAIDALFNIRDPDPDRLLADAARALAELTNCAAFSTTITPGHVTIRRIEFVPVGRSTAMVMVVASNSVVKSRICRVHFSLTAQIVEFFNRFANDRFAGRAVGEMSKEYVSSVAVALGEYSVIFGPILAAIYDLCSQISAGQYFARGEENLLTYREFDQIAYQIFTLLSHSERLTEIIPRESSRISITIGKENAFSELARSTVMVATYPINQDSTGAIGILGPVRMDYNKLIPNITYFSQTLGKLLRETMND